MSVASTMSITVWRIICVGTTVHNCSKITAFFNFIQAEVHYNREEHFIPNALWYRKWIKYHIPQHPSIEKPVTKNQML